MVVREGRGVGPSLVADRRRTTFWQLEHMVANLPKTGKLISIHGRYMSRYVFFGTPAFGYCPAADTIGTQVG